MLKKWFKAAIIRAGKTAAEVAGGFVVAGLAFWEIDWWYACSVAGVAFIASMLWSVSGIPEVDDGNSVFKIEEE